MNGTKTPLCGATEEAWEEWKIKRHALSAILENYIYLRTILFLIQLFSLYSMLSGENEA